MEHAKAGIWSTHDKKILGRSRPRLIHFLKIRPRSRKNTEVKQLGPRLALGWVTIQGLDVDAVATNTVKSQMRRNGASKYASGAKNKKY